nr:MULTISPECIES: response regulator [Myxococcaceae]
MLFVDDEVDVLDLLTRAFERRFRVLRAQSGAEALELLRQGPVDALITDQKMPGMSGTQLVAAARAEGMDVTTILLTGYTDPEDIIAAINQGQVYRYVTKPWDLTDLQVTVNGAVELTQLRRDRERLLRKLQQRVDALGVLYDVSRQSAQDPPSYDAIIDRVLSAVGRVLPYDCGAAVVSVNGGRSATLRLRCRGLVGERALVGVKDQMIAAYRKSSGYLLPEDRLTVRVSGTVTQEVQAQVSFASQLSVPLTASGRTVGTLTLFSRAPGAYGDEDGALLDVLANQTTDAIQALRASEEEARLRVERMVESMADGVLLTDEKNELVVLNPAARRLLRLGDDPAEATARHLQEKLGFYPFELVRGWEYGGAQALVEELHLFDRTVQSTVTPVNDARGQLRGVCVVLRDVTEQKRLEERKDAFVSMVSHELRTPLTSISGALDLVLNFLTGELNEKQHRYLSMARESTDRLNAIVDDLLDLSKFAQGRMRMRFELGALDDLVRRAAEHYGPAFLEKRIRVTLQLPAQPLKAVADADRLTQVLNNLLTNAVKFTPRDGDIRLDLSASPELPGWVVLSCWNNGEPIPERDLERIFDRFEQAHSPRTRAVRGTGLGLAISRSIVEAHGGRIWAEPCADGAHFVAVLPVEPPQNADEAARVDEPAARRALAGASVGRVLVVEQDAALGYGLKALLAARGFEVRFASSAEEALALARRDHPQAIVLGSQLPDVGGLQVAEILRHDPETRGVRLLVLSRAEERGRAFSAGADAFLLKPVQPGALEAAVESLVRGAGARSHGRVLVIDDDLKIASICREVLESHGFEVALAGSLADARRALRERRPDLLVLDVQLPDGDGFGFLEELKAERAGSHISVIFVSARTETAAKVRALKLGGDDYLTKPFDALELGARVESVLRRREQELNASPTTQLPGSGAIEREVQGRLQGRTPFAFCYLDLDNLKAFNDFYGFAKADGVVRQTGDLLREVVAQEGLPGDFLGHVAGDDFVFITTPETVDRVCTRLIESFDRIIPLYYDRQDRERGYIEGEDRFGERRRFPVMSVSIVAVMTDGSGSVDHAELARRAADLKKRAKAIPGSVYLRSDRDAGVRSAG